MKRPRGSCVLAFAPHSGWAAAIAIGGSGREPSLVARERLELAGRLPGARQPYHAIEPLPLAEAGARLAAFRESAAALAIAGVGALVETARAVDLEPIAAVASRARSKRSWPRMR